MNSKKKQLITLLLLAVFLLAGSFLIEGCKKSEPAPPESEAETMQNMEGHEGHDHAASTEEVAAEVVAAAEQTECPVMGGAIDKAIFVEYKGKKVYFCCEPCKGKFEEAPEQYIAKLPQFNQ